MVRRSSYYDDIFKNAEDKLNRAMRKMDDDLQAASDRLDNEMKDLDRRLDEMGSEFDGIGGSDIGNILAGGRNVSITTRDGKTRIKVDGKEYSFGDNEVRDSINKRVSQLDTVVRIFKYAIIVMVMIFAFSMIKGFITHKKYEVKPLDNSAPIEAPLTPAPDSGDSMRSL